MIGQFWYRGFNFRIFKFIYTVSDYISSSKLLKLFILIRIEIVFVQWLKKQCPFSIWEILLIEEISYKSMCFIFLYV